MNGAAKTGVHNTLEPVLVTYSAKIRVPFIQRQLTHATLLTTFSMEPFSKEHCILVKVVVQRIPDSSLE